MTVPGSVVPEPHPYQYFVLRLVPRIDREEFVNVGVVLYSQAADVLDCAWHLDRPRLAALAPGLDETFLCQVLATIQDICRGREEAGPLSLGAAGERFGWLAAPRSTVVQPGPVHGGLTEDPSGELERLVDILVR